VAEEMRREPRVFGTDRVIETPISEPGHAGIGVVMFGDFMGASPYTAFRLGCRRWSPAQAHLLGVLAKDRATATRLRAPSDHSRRAR
jgi:hypothetical protein